MKKLIQTSFLSFAALLAAVSCDDAIYNEGGKDGDTLGVHAFFAESIKAPGIASSSVKLSTQDGAKIALTPSLTDKISEDCVVKIVMDQKILDQYNAAQGTSFQMFPESMVHTGENITIQAGKYAADAAVINIDKVTDEMVGLPFAIPVRLEKVSGNMETTSNTSAYVIEVKSIMINDIAQFDGASGLKANIDQTFSQFTLEVRFQVENTRNRNRDLLCWSLNDDGGEMMCRFEDPQKDENGMKAHSLVQFQGCGDYLNPTNTITPNKWEHYALTYDGSKVTIYVNGVASGSKAIKSSAVKDGYFKYITFLGIGGFNGYWAPGDSPWYYCKTMCTECRIWSVCRTADQISKNITSVSPDTKGLEGYWKVNKATWNEEKREFADLTGKGHPLTTNKNFKWNEGISSEDTATPWK